MPESPYPAKLASMEEGSGVLLVDRGQIERSWTKFEDGTWRNAAEGISDNDEVAKAVEEHDTDPPPGRYVLTADPPLLWSALEAIAQTFWDHREVWSKEKFSGCVCGWRARKSDNRTQERFDSHVSLYIDQAVAKAKGKSGG